MKLRLHLPSSRPPPRWLLGLLVADRARRALARAGADACRRRDRRLLRRSTSPAATSTPARGNSDTLVTCRRTGHAGDADARSRPGSGPLTAGTYQLRAYTTRSTRPAARPRSASRRRRRSRAASGKSIHGQRPADRSDRATVPPVRQRLLQPGRDARRATRRRRTSTPWTTRRAATCSPSCRRRRTGSRSARLGAGATGYYEFVSRRVCDQPTPTTVTPADPAR